MTNTSASPPTSMTEGQITDGIRRIDEKISELKAYDPAAFREPEPDALSILAYGILEVLETTFGEGTAAFDRFSRAARLGARPLPAASDRAGVERHRREVVDNIRRSQAVLREAVAHLKREGAARTASTAHVPTPPRVPETWLDRIGKPLAVGASIATITGATVFGSVSGWTAVSAWWPHVAQGPGSEAPTSAKPMPVEPKDDRAAPAPASAPADPQTCARLAKGAAEAAEQGFLLKAERLQGMMAETACRRAAAPP